MDTKKITTVLIGIVTIIAIGAVIKITQTVLLPFVVAVLLSFILNPLIEFLNKIHIPKIIAIILVILMLFGFCYLIGLFLYASVDSFIKEYPKYQQRFIRITDSFSVLMDTKLKIPEGLFTEIDWAGAIRGSLVSLSGSFMGFFSSLIITSILLVFILLEQPLLKYKLVKAFPRETYKKIGLIFIHTNKQIGRFLSVKLFISFLTGFSIWLCLKIIGLDFAFIWGALGFFLNFIPNFGSVIVMLITILMGFVQFFPSTGKILAVSISMILVQTVFGSFLDPKLQGYKLNLSPLLIIFSLILWGWLWGIAGMFLAVPITAVIKIVFENIPFMYPVSVLMGNGKERKKKLKK